MYISDDCLGYILTWLPINESIRIARHHTRIRYLLYTTTERVVLSPQAVIASRPFLIPFIHRVADRVRVFHYSSPSMVERGMAGLSISETLNIFAHLGTSLEQFIINGPIVSGNKQEQTPGPNWPCTRLKRLELAVTSYETPCALDLSLAAWNRLAKGAPALSCLVLPTLPPNVVYPRGPDWCFIGYSSTMFEDFRKALESRCLNIKIARMGLVRHFLLFVALWSIWVDLHRASHPEDESTLEVLLLDAPVPEAKSEEYLTILQTIVKDERIQWRAARLVPEGINGMLPSVDRFLSDLIVSLSSLCKWDLSAVKVRADEWHHKYFTPDSWECR